MQHYQELKLWPNEAPFAEPGDEKLVEHFANCDNGINRLTDIARPSITYYPTSGKGPHPSVLVCPGGGYSILAWNHEGQDICSFFNTIGFTAFLLKYRCPGKRTAAHADAVRAMRLIRHNAAEFNIDPAKVGIMGFSAGAHLAATVSAPHNGTPYQIIDDADALPFRPNFTALIYPAYLADQSLTLAPEFHIDANVPPTFLLQAENDSIKVENSIAWFMALKKAGVKAEMHIYPEGAHGYGILRTGNPIADWPALASKWFRQQAGIL